MPSDAAPRLRMTAAEYLAWERQQPDKHEFYRGEVFAMAGGSRRHNYLSLTIGSALLQAVRPQGCHVLSSDQRVAAPPEDRYVYADAVVTCGERAAPSGDADVLEDARIVVEVLSPSTERYDRGEKWEAYQRLPSLSDYLLVSQLAPRIEQFQREPDCSWRYRVYGPGDVVPLLGGGSVAVDAVYEGAFELDAG